MSKLDFIIQGLSLVLELSRFITLGSLIFVMY